MDVNAFWQAFLSESGLPDTTEYLECFHFELSEYWADELLCLVMCGQKRATESSLTAYKIEGERVPQAGDLSIVTD